MEGRRCARHANVLWNECTQCFLGTRCIVCFIFCEFQIGSLACQWVGQGLTFWEDVCYSQLASFYPVSFCPSSALIKHRCQPVLQGKSTPEFCLPGKKRTWSPSAVVNTSLGFLPSLCSYSYLCLQIFKRHSLSFSTSYCTSSLVCFQHFNQAREEIQLRRAVGTSSSFQICWQRLQL